MRRPLIPALISAAVLAAATIMSTMAFPAAAGAAAFPHYDHIFLIVNENTNYSNVIGSPEAPEINALASGYGIATHYTGVGDPSEPNYVAMLGGSTFGLSDDNPYFWPGHSISAPNLPSQLEAAGLTWKAYIQALPYAGYRGYCYPAKCLGIPDSDMLFASKHDGLDNFANLQTPAEFAKQTPYSQLAADLAAGSVPNFSYIIPTQCQDMHGAPPWCTDSGKAGDPYENELEATADAFTGATVNEITSSPMWETGNNAIILTSDEGNTANSTIATVVVTNHGPRGVKDNTSSDHYSLLASMEDAFGLPCLQNACSATPMTPLFTITGSNTVPALPPPAAQVPNGNNSISAQASPVKGTKTSLSCASGWQQVPSPSIGSLDNNLTAVSAASPSDAWAVGDYYTSNNPNVLVNMAEHWDGSTWSEYPLPNVGSNQNTLLGVSELPSGSTWAAGYYTDANWVDQTLIEHWNGSQWSVVPSPNAGPGDNILYGIAALSDTDIWAVGTTVDANDVTHPLAEHYDGTSWSVAPTVDPNGGANTLYALDAVSSKSVYAVGQTGTSFPSHALIEHWNGSAWSQLSSPADAAESLTSLGVTGTDSNLTVVGDRESGTAPYTTEVASGAPSSLSLAASANITGDENDLFGATTAADGSVYAVGWAADPSTGNYSSLIEHGVTGQWSIDTTPDPGSSANGFAGVTAIPGGGVWAVGAFANKGNNATLIAYHC